MPRKFMSLLATAGLVAAGIAVVAQPAAAHDVFQGDDFVEHSYDATSFLVCDEEDDGHAVWAGYYDNSSYDYKTAPVIYISDPSGEDCTQWSIAPLYLTNIRVVEDNPSSSTNYYGPWHGYPVKNN